MHRAAPIRLLLILCLLFLCGNSTAYRDRVTVGNVDKFKDTMSKHEQKLKMLNTTLYKQLASEARNETREAWVRETLRQAAGVYKDKSKSKALGIEKTVFLVVIAYPVGAHYYKVYFRNFLCFVHHFGIDLVVYVVHHGDGDPDVEIENLRKLGVRALTYPEELFWKVVSNKMQPIHVGGFYAKYNGTKISFQDFGALPMLIPPFEVLENGYNVIYFDIDIALVHDPVPFLIQGDADFVTSIENRACREEYYGAVPTKIDWERIEPNTGIMHLRATKQGLKFYAVWLERIVDNNFSNDQRALSRRILNATYVPNCLSPDTPGLRNPHAPTIRKSPDSPTYCLLSDIAFQNGMVGLTCQSKRNSHDNWLLSTFKHGFRVGNKSYPVTLHVNFCNGKSKELSIRNLWLYEDHDHDGKSSGSGLHEAEYGCKPYRLNESYYSQLNWVEEVQSIEEKIRQALLTILLNGTFVKRDGAHEIHMILRVAPETTAVSREVPSSQSFIKRAFPDGDTFLNFGYSWDTVHVHSVPGYILDRVPDGPPFPSTLDWNKATEYVKLKKKQYMDSLNYIPFISPNLDDAGKPFSGKAI